MTSRLHPSAGIAIGPILFVLALLGIIASVISAGSGSGSLGGAAVSDRISADVVSQANMVRAKILECQMQFLTNSVTYAVSPCEGDPYPCSDQTDGTLVGDLVCPNDPPSGLNLWTGQRAALLPPPSKGMNAWRYMNAGDSGGRCIWTSPSSGKTAQIAAGLKRAADKFSSQELSYDPNSDDQKFVVFITLPTGTVHSNCALP